MLRDRHNHERRTLITKYSCLADNEISENLLNQLHNKVFTQFHKFYLFTSFVQVFIDYSE